jgi:hypothetical protein
MMEAARTSETSVDNHFTRQYNPEDSSEQHKTMFVVVVHRATLTKTVENKYHSDYQKLTSFLKAGWV